MVRTRPQSFKYVVGEVCDVHNNKIQQDPWPGKDVKDRRRRRRRSNFESLMWPAANVNGPTIHQGKKTVLF